MEPYLTAEEHYDPMILKTLAAMDRLKLNAGLVYHVQITFLSPEEMESPMFYARCLANGVYGHSITVGVELPDGKTLPTVCWVISRTDDCPRETIEDAAITGIRGYYFGASR